MARFMITLIVLLSIVLTALLLLRPTFDRYGTSETPVLQTTVGYAFPGLVSFHVGHTRYLFMSGQVQTSQTPYGTRFGDTQFTSY